MKFIKIFQPFDLFVQALLIANVSIPLVGAIFNNDFLMWTLMGLLPLGIWQLLSAGVLGLGLPDKFRGLYLITAIAYCSLFFSGGFLLDKFGISPFYQYRDYIFLVALGISFIAGWYYFLYSLRSFRAEKKEEFL